MDRPYSICHILSALDGNVDELSLLPAPAAGR